MLYASIIFRFYLEVELPLSSVRLTNRRRAVWVAGIGLCSGILLLDFFLPLGVAIGMLYACIVFFAAKYFRDSDVLLMAGGCTVLVLVGAVIGPILDDVPLWMGIINRIMSIIVIWLPVTLLIQDQRTRRLLHAVNEELEARVAERTLELERNREDLRALTGRLLVAHEEERQRLARDLHDDFNQRLGMVVLDLGMFERELPPAGDGAGCRLRRLQSMVSRLSDDLRRLAHEFHPSILQDLGLTVAIRRLLDEWSSCAAIKVSLESNCLPETVSPEVATCLYRVAQESLANVAKHSHASDVHVLLTGNHTEIALVVRDNGKGCVKVGADEIPRGLGLLSMKERVAQVGGLLAVESPNSGGTVVHVWVPIAEAQQK